MWTVLAIATLLAIIVIRKTFIVVDQSKEVIKERLGKYTETLKPGFHFLIPFIDKASYIQEVREQVFDIPAQSCITSDNIQVEVDGVVYLKVMDTYKASYGIGNYKLGAINLAQTTMRAAIGKLSLDQSFTEREALNERIVEEIDKASDPWGIKVLRYEIKNIEPSRTIIDTMEKQMEAERAKRAEITLSTGEKDARILVSEGERQAAINLSEGEKQKRINEAEGKAAEISLVAEASAEGIKSVSESIQKPGGDLAVKLQLAEQYVDQYEEILANARVTVLPEKMAELRSMVKGLGVAFTGKEV